MTHPAIERQFRGDVEGQVLGTGEGGARLLRGPILRILAPSATAARTPMKPFTGVVMLRVSTTPRMTAAAPASAPATRTSRVARASTFWMRLTLSSSRPWRAW